MIRNAKTLERHELLARDGAIGHVDDLYFDDQQWSIRYFVVDAGSWLVSRRVLISPLSVDLPDWENKILPVNLTKEQVRNSPGIDTDKPISRQHEVSLSDYYGWPYYWADPLFSTMAFAGPMGVLPSVSAPKTTQSAAAAESADTAMIAHEDADPHLRSINATLGHRIEARDGTIGHVDDFLVEDIGLSWNESKVYVDLSRDAVKGSPPYDLKTPLNSDYAGRLHDHYGRPRDDRWQT